MRKILVAYDGGEPGRRALELAAQIGHAFASRIDVISVVPQGFGHPGDRTADHEEAPAIVHARELVEAREILRDRGVDAGLIEPAGNPAQTVEALSAERDYDLIVVGASRAVSSGGPLDQSIGVHIATHARTPVLIAN